MNNAAMKIEEREIKFDDGTYELNGRNYINNHKGDPQRLDAIKAQDFLEDQMVRKVCQ